MVREKHRGPDTKSFTFYLNKEVMNELHKILDKRRKNNFHRAVFRSEIVCEAIMHFGKKGEN